jgi:hypothetical protein
VKVLINGRYAYETDLDDVEVGDEMLLPGSFSGPWTGIVTALEPEYSGRCVKAMGLSRRRAKVESEREALEEVKISGWRVGAQIPKRCEECGDERNYIVKAVNNIGRPTSLRAGACHCGAPPQGCGLGDAASFRHFMIEPSR